MSKVDETITKYAIITRKTELKMYVSKEAKIEGSDRIRDGQLTVEVGTLLKVFNSNPVENKKCNTVQVLDFLQHNPIYENSLFECPQSSMQKVNEDLWPYVISINDAERRLPFLMEQEKSRWVIYLKLNDFVSVGGESFGRDATVRYDCIIRYIGPVQELSPSGYCFGLELLNLEYGHSPQNDVSLVEKYMRTDPSLAILTTPDNLIQISTESKKKFSAIDLFNGAVEKVRTAIAPGVCLDIPQKTQNKSMRREKKPKKKEPTSYFYDDTPITPNALKDNPFRLLSTSPVGTMDRKTLKLNKESISVETEEFKQAIENHEKNIERRNASKNDDDSQIVNAPQPPPGILKHRRTPTVIDKDETAASAKSSMILSLGDRDIVIIDKADIREATKNEGNVVVVDKQRVQQDVDLADLLGSNWPNTAGDAANILNKQKPLSDHGKQCKKTLNSISNNNETPVNQERGRRNTDKNSQNLSKFPIGKSKKNGPNADLPKTIVPSPDTDFIENSPLHEIPNTGLGVGSMVEVCVPESTEDLYGVIRWIGMPPGAPNVMVGIELEEENANKILLTTNGTFNDLPLFKCLDGRALFVTPDQCTRDKRFLDAEGTLENNAKKNSADKNVQLSDSKTFGKVECPSVPGAIAPLKILNLNELEQICGKFKGIQGHHNSCYLDATLFSMFAFTSVFDSLLFRSAEPEDISHYLEVQVVLREEIVNPLRRNMFVRADRVMKLRQLLDKLSSISGLMSEEKDPEEFINSLLAQIMRVEPFLKLSSGQDAYFYQLFVEKDERLLFPTVQQLFEQSFHSSDIKLKEVPSCLIIQMPRFGKNFKMYPRILPSQVLDVTDIIEDSPRQCSVCGKLAEFECRDCFNNLQVGSGLECTAFCATCLPTVHNHPKRSKHTSKKISVPQDFRMMAEHMNVPRLYMELFAVVCIETSHYVAFVKAGCGEDAPWCFFDSMADRKGEQNGYNIPELVTVPDMPLWLCEEGARVINETSSNDKMLPEHAKRLFCDAYMCMYQSTDVMMYR